MDKELSEKEDKALHDALRADTRLVSASGSNELLCSMPRELTAENGAKGLLSGEFYVTTTHTCPKCNDSDDIVNCSCCEGVGEIEQRTYIDWTTIKEIYAMAVKHLGT